MVIPHVILHCDISQFKCVQPYKNGWYLDTTMEDLRISLLPGIIRVKGRKHTLDFKRVEEHDTNNFFSYMSDKEESAKYDLQPMFIYINK